ncbi:MAG TPA: ABC transporter substrate-binding protein, partial [Micromonosporaceae bacterium]|nr:ABC transporter substrate-binding protein [Micromonosporaceae bacterium]
MLAPAGCVPAGSGSRSVDTVEQVTYLTGFGLLGQDAYAFLARDKGYFRDVGLDVDIKPGAGTGENLKLLLAGQATFAIVDLTGALLAYGGGARGFTAVAAIHQRSVSCIIALRGSGIAAPRDLAGHTVGYQPGGVNYTLFPVYAKLAGIDAA